MKPESRTVRPFWSALFLGLAALLLTLQAKETKAQYALSIPFDPWQAQYEAFIYPVVPTDLSLPNQARLQSGRWGSGSSRFQSEFDPLRDSTSWLDAYIMGQSAASPASRERLGAATGGRFIPYHSFNRLHDSTYNRQYTPNAGADQGYYEERARREDLYLQSLSERDPQKRAELLRQLERANRALRDELGTTTRRLPGGPTSESTALREGTGARRGSASPISPATRTSTDRDASPTIPPAPDALEDRPANRVPGLPPSSLTRPRSSPGDLRPTAPRSRAPDLGPDGRRNPETDPDRDPSFSGPSRRRGPANPAQPR